MLWYELQRRFKKLGYTLNFISKTVEGKARETFYIITPEGRAKYFNNRKDIENLLLKLEA